MDAGADPFHIPRSARQQQPEVLGGRGRSRFSSKVVSRELLREAPEEVPPARGGQQPSLSVDENLLQQTDRPGGGGGGRDQVEEGGTQGSRGRWNQLRQEGAEARESRRYGAKKTKSQKEKAKYCAR